MKNGERFARWTVRGKKRTAKVTGDGDSLRVRTDSSTWYVRFSLADGSRVNMSTGCRDKSAAASKVAELVAEQEKIRGGIITASEAKTAKHGHRAYADMVAAFIESMAARGCAASTGRDWKHYLESAGMQGLGWQTLRDTDRADLERWLSMRAVTPRDKEGAKSLMGARLHNAYVEAFSAFGAWCARQRYVKTNPFEKLVKRDRQADRRRIRRALTLDELQRLVEAAAARPLLEASLICRGPNKGRSGARLSAATKERLHLLGWTRALAYRTAAATGLRWGELRSITLGAVRLDADTPHLILEARHEKARRGAQIPLPASLATELEEYVSELRSRLLRSPGTDTVTFPNALDTVVLFDVPQKTNKVFDADCEAAGIPKRDGAGRVVDVHALRHTFGTMLAKAGVSLQVAQRAMRHSTPTLTANVYTHLELLDVASAVEKLPCVGATSKREARKAANLVTPSVIPNSDNPWCSGAFSGNHSTTKRFCSTESNNRVSANKDRVLQAGAREMNGRGGRIRTGDPLVPNQVR